MSISKTSSPNRYSSLSLQDVIGLCFEGGDEEAWEEFVSRAGKPMGFIIRRTAALWGEHSRVQVEDLLQATYLKLWEGGGGVCGTLRCSIPKLFGDI